MRRTLRSISQNYPRQPDISQIQQDIYNSNSIKDNMINIRTTSSTEQRNDIQYKQGHRNYNQSLDEYSSNPHSILNQQNEYIEQLYCNKPFIKKSQVVKFEQGRLVKQVEGNQIIKGFEMDNIREHNRLIKVQNKLPSVQLEQICISQQSPLSKKQQNNSNINSIKQRKNSEIKNNLSLNQYLNSLNISQSDKEQQNAAQKLKVSFVEDKSNKEGDQNILERSYVQKTKLKTPNKQDESFSKSPQRVVKTEQCENDQQDCLKNYQQTKLDSIKLSSIINSPIPTEICEQGQASQCPAKTEKSQLESKLHLFVNSYDEYFKHIKGECLCVRCICGGCKCGAQKPKAEQLMKQNKTHYESNFNSKPTNKDKLSFDHTRYITQPTKDSKFMGQTTSQTDYQPPINAEKSNQIIKPDTLTSGPAIQWETSYNRNYIHFGNLKNLHVQRGNDRTTTDKMKFIDGTTYNKFYNKRDNSPPIKQFDAFVPVGSLSFTLKNAKPLSKETTNNHYYKPYNVNGVEQKLDQKDHIMVGSVSFNGQYDSNHRKDYTEKNKICPAKIEKQDLIQSKRKLELERLLNSQNESYIDNYINNKTKLNIVTIK